MFAWHIFLIGALLGILQFGLGFWIGRILSSRRRQASRSISEEFASVEKDGDPERLQDIMERVQGMIRRVGNDVNHHQVRIEQVTKDLQGLKTRSISIAEEVIWKQLNQLLHMMGDLNSRLGEVESQMHAHSKQIGWIRESQNGSWGETVKESHDVEGDKTEESGEVDSMVESVRSRLNELVQPTSEE